jgi:DUF2892 family protein
MSLLSKNEHAVERVVRVMLGVALLSLVFIGPKTYWGLLGAVPVLTGVLGSCPVYSIFGISTCRLR